MLYTSTRGASPHLGFLDTFAAGLAPDGGLYVPADLPDISHILSDPPTSYPDLAFAFLSLFDTDHPPGRLAEIVRKSYSSFHHPDTAPLHQLGPNLHVLELFHGPTLAFKDFGLQLVGNLFEDQIARTGLPINVLGATSGDTGSAAIHGLANRAGTSVFILYPKGRISPLQERQMACTGAPNIFPIPIEGSFDDAQRIVKTLFGDLDFKAGARLSAVNSINLARVLAQSIYYIHAHNELNRSRPASAHTAFSYIVPTGNFGNIFAGWLAARMGLPAAGFQIATNRNDILFRLFTEGRYQPGAVDPSLAPSMDIQVASNFERFLYYMLGQDGPAVAGHMAHILSENALALPNFDPGPLTATRSSDAEILEATARVYSSYSYLVDPHTACAFKGVDPDKPTVILSTAHPAKFPETLERATGQLPSHPILEALKGLPLVTYPLPPSPDAIRDFIRANSS